MSHLYFYFYPIEDFQGADKTGYDFEPNDETSINKVFGYC